jgi:hypothetical protein
LEDLKQSIGLLAKLEAKVLADKVASATKRRRVDPSSMSPAPVAAHPAAAPRCASRRQEQERDINRNIHGAPKSGGREAA